MKTKLRFMLIILLILGIAAVFSSCDTSEINTDDTQPSEAIAEIPSTSAPEESKFIFDPAEYQPTEGSPTAAVIEKIGVLVDGKYYNSLAIAKYSQTFNGYDNDGTPLWSTIGERFFPILENSHFPEGCAVIVTQFGNEIEIIGDYHRYTFIDKSTTKWFENCYPDQPGLYWLSIEDSDYFDPMNDPGFVPPDTYPQEYVLDYQYVFLIAITE